MKCFRATFMHVAYLVIHNHLVCTSAMLVHMQAGWQTMESSASLPKRKRGHHELAVEKVHVRPRLGAGEQTVARWPSDCNPARLGEAWELTSFNNLEILAADDHVRIWFRGRSHTKTARKEGTTGSKYWLFWLNGPKGSVLPWYTRVRAIMGAKRGSFQDLPHARDLKVFELTNFGLNNIENPLQANGAGVTVKDPTDGGELIDDDEDLVDLEGFVETRRHFLEAGEEVAQDIDLGHPAQNAWVHGLGYSNEAQMQKRFADLCTYARHVLEVHRKNAGLRCCVV